MAHQIAVKAVRGTISVIAFRDPADGTEHHAVVYDSLGERWLSDRRFTEPSQADAAASVLSEFLGAKVTR